MKYFARSGFETFLETLWKILNTVAFLNKLSMNFWHKMLIFLLILITQDLSISATALGKHRHDKGKIFKRDTSTISQYLSSDPLDGVKKMTSRAVITVSGRNRSRILNVYSASLNGLIEFGFPPIEEQGLSGILHIFSLKLASTNRLCLISICTITVTGSLTTYYKSFTRQLANILKFYTNVKRPLYKYNSVTIRQPIVYNDLQCNYVNYKDD